MGNAISKLCAKISDYKREREKRKIMKIYSRVFQNDGDLHSLNNPHCYSVGEI